MAWKVTERGERWGTCMCIKGLVREKTEKLFQCFPHFMIDCTYEVLVPHLTFRGIVNIHPQQV